MAKRMTKEQKRLDTEFRLAFNKHGNCRAFDIFDLSKIEDEAKAAVLDPTTGVSMDEAVKAACDRYEKKAA